MKNISQMQSPLWKGIAPQDLGQMLQCLTATERQYQKGEFLFYAGDKITAVGLVLSGCLHLVQEDFWGNRAILAEVTEGQLFGETYACIPSETLHISVYAAQDTKVLYLDVQRILQTCTSACHFHTQLIRNLLEISARKNLMLTQKISHMNQRTTREKLLSYLSEQAQKAGSACFTIPFSRQQLADYLCVERSAMSNTLCKLRDEGVLSFVRNRFELYDYQEDE